LWRGGCVMGENKENACVKCLQKILKVIMASILMILVVGSVLNFPRILERLSENNFFPEYLSESTIGNGEYPSVLSEYKKVNEDCPSTPSAYKENLINEIEVSLAFLASIATIAIAIGAYTQLRALKQSSKNSATTLQMDFVRHLDQQWCSKETTETRYELWTEYRKAIKRKDDCWPDICEKACKQEVGIKAVQNYVVQIDEKGKSEPTIKHNKELFEHLNFLELMGSIYLYKKQEIIDDEMLKNLFAGRLHTYLKFYEKYLKSHYSDKLDDKQPYALKLLEYLDELEAEKKG